MTTRTTVLPAPVDIETPDSVIQEWLNNWNKGNVSPITLEDLDDITYDFIYRAADHAANLELTKCLFYLRTSAASQEEDLASALLAYRRPKGEDDLDQIRTDLMKEIEDLKDFMMTKIIKLKNKIPQKKH
tara:strand:- start:90 stop:479 length:390 start_codon:yes stop_codon:yes gene_type:complete